MDINTSIANLQCLGRQHALHKVPCFLQNFEPQDIHPHLLQTSELTVHLYPGFHWQNPTTY